MHFQNLFIIFLHPSLFLIKLSYFIGDSTGSTEGSELFNIDTAMERSAGFPCPQCGRSYKYQHNLVQHIQYKCGKAEFACAVCPMRFKNKLSLKNHAEKKHGLELL